MTAAAETCSLQLISSFVAGGGNVKIENRKVELAGVKSRIGSLDNAKYTPRGGEKKVTVTAPHCTWYS